MPAEQAPATQRWEQFRCNTYGLQCGAQARCKLQCFPYFPPIFTNSFTTAPLVSWQASLPEAQARPRASLQQLTGGGLCPHQSPFSYSIPAASAEPKLLPGGPDERRALRESS